MDKKTSEFQNFFIADELCLDLCNTFDHLHVRPQIDHFTDAAVVLRWARAAGILSADHREFPLSEKGSFEQLLQTRALIFRLFFPFSQAALPSKADLDSFNDLLQEKNARTKIAAEGRRFSLTFKTRDALEKIEYEAIRSAAALLLSLQPGRLKQCEGCGWLFHDKSRTHARRWCTMELCGNRAKARRHYERSRPS